MEDPVFPLERNLYGHPLAGLLWESNLRNSYCNTVGRRFPIGNAYLCTVKKGHSYLCMWMTSNWLERNKTLIRCGKLLNKEVDLGEPTSFLDHVYLGCTQRQCDIRKDMWTIRAPCLNREFPRGELKNYHTRKIFVFLRGRTICHAKKCVERYCELANRTTQQLYTVSTPCIDDHHFKEKKRNLLENCHKCALKLF